MRFEIASTATEGVLDRDTIYRRIFRMSDEEIERIKEGKKFDKLEDLTLESMQAPVAAAPAGGEPLPGEEELPSTLGGPEAGAETPPETPAEPAPESADGLIAPVISEDSKGFEPGSRVQLVQDPDWGLGVVLPATPRLRGNVKFHFIEWDKRREGGDRSQFRNWVADDQLRMLGMSEKRNPGSEGDDASMAVDKGKDLFSTGEDQHSLVFGTEKQTASDPADMRSLRRLVTRPFSEKKSTPAGREAVDMRLREAIQRTEKVAKSIDRSMEEMSKGNMRLAREIRKLRRAGKNRIPED